MNQVAIFTSVLQVTRSIIVYWYFYNFIYLDDQLHFNNHFLLKDLIKQAGDKLCLLESILYSRQHPVRDTNELPSNSTLVKVQRCTLEVEERLTGLVKHVKMLKEMKNDLEKFHRNTSEFLNDSSNLAEELASIDKERSDIEDFEDAEVKCFLISCLWVDDRESFKILVMN